MCVLSTAALKAGTFFITCLPRNIPANFTVLEYKQNMLFCLFAFLFKIIGDCQEVMGLWSIKILVKVAIRASHEISDDTSFHWKTLNRQSQKVSC